MAGKLTNLAFYRFFRLQEQHNDLQVLRAELRQFLVGLGLKGTVLLASEGMNGMVSGSPEAILELKQAFIERFGFQESAFKASEVEVHSFNRLLVKVKKEIITIGDPEVKPDQETGRFLPAAELKRWMDEGRSFILLDTRNQYEIEVGTFRGAMDLKIKHSREFTEKAKEAIPLLKDQPVVTFCTGGIRCEKGSALLMKLGLKDVYQLEGGILRYFEENGAAHFDGKCFVFDWRLAVDGELKPIVRSEDSYLEFGRHRINHPDELSKGD